jgi:hypothetical protein
LQTISELDVRMVIPGHGAPFSDVQGALQRARQRLDYLSADPQRNARNALKVLLAFILLDTQKLHLDQALLQFNSSRLMRSAARQLAMPAQELLQQIAAELVRCWRRPPGRRAVAGIIARSDCGLISTLISTDNQPQ